MAVACGRSHTAVVTEHGQLWACGAGDKGALSLTALEHQPVPAFVGGLEMFGAPIVMIAAGEHHSAALAADGAVWTWGEGDFCALGHGDRVTRPTPTQLGKEAFGESAAVMVACGEEHTLVVTEDGELWTCGQSYALGHGDYADRLVPTRVGAGRFGGAKIAMVAAGSLHSIAVTTQGAVWTFGFGASRALGHNDEEDRMVPAQIDGKVFGGSPVVMVAAGTHCSVAVTAEGVLFSWGKGEYGQLGLGNTDNRLTPTRVGGREVFGGSPVRMAVCCVYHTLAVTEEGGLWSWGFSVLGALGHSNTIQRLIPTRVGPQHFDGAKIVTAAAGNFHSTAVTEHGALYTWGKADFEGAPTGLGHADMQDKLVPTRIAARHMEGARVGRYQTLLPQHALAFAMGTHTRLGSAQTAAPAGGSSLRRSKRLQVKAADDDDNKGCAYLTMPDDLLQRVVESSTSRPEGGAGRQEGVVQLMGGGRTKGGV